MTAVFRSLWLLLVGIALAILGIGAFNTLTALRMDIADFDIRAIGVVLAIHCSGFVVGSFLAPKAIARRGAKFSFILFALICASAAILHLVSITPLAWGLIRFWFGLGNGALAVTYESWINAATGNQWRGRVMAGYMTINFLSYALAQQLLRPFPPAGWTLFAVCALLLTIATVPIWRAKAPVIEAAPLLPLRFSDLLKRAPLGPVGIGAAGLIIGGFGHLAPIFARARHDDDAFIAKFMMTVLLSAFVVQGVIGWLSDRIGRRPVLIGLAAFAGLAAHLIAGTATNDDHGLMLGLILFGAAGYSLYSVSVAIANDAMSPGEMVSASGHLQVAFGVATIFGPLIGSFAMNIMGPAGLFVYIAAIGFMLVILGIGLGALTQNR